MVCRILSTIIYKKFKSKYIKQLLKVLDKPETYRKMYLDFFEKFQKYKDGKYSFEDIPELFDNLLKSKGLRVIKDIEEELDAKKNIIKSDNQIIIQLRKETEILDNRIRDLQQFVYNMNEDYKSYKQTTEDKMSVIRNKTEIKEKRKYKQRSKAKVNNQEKKDMIIEEEEKE